MYQTIFQLFNLNALYNATMPTKFNSAVITKKINTITSIILSLIIGKSSIYIKYDSNNASWSHPMCIIKNKENNT